MATKRIYRPRDPIALAKLIGETATGQVKEDMPEDGKDEARPACVPRRLLRAGNNARSTPRNRQGCWRRLATKALAVAVFTGTCAAFSAWEAQDVSSGIPDVPQVWTKSDLPTTRGKGICAALNLMIGDLLQWGITVELWIDGDLLTSIADPEAVNVAVIIETTHSQY